MVVDNCKSVGVVCQNPTHVGKFDPDQAV